MPTHHNRHLNNLNFTEFTNSFSIWVILGTPICYVYFCQLFQAPVFSNVLLCLTLTVWIIYTADHVVDGFIRKADSLTLRHYLHHRYHRLLIAGIVVSTLVVLAIAFTSLDSRIRNFGIGLSSVLLAYFFINRWIAHKFSFNLPLKELGIAAVVALCFAYMPLVQSSYSDGLGDHLLILSFGGINASNLFIFSTYDYQLDQKNKLSSIGQLLSPNQLKVLSLITTALSFVVLVYATYLMDAPISLVFVLYLMILQLLIIQLFSRYFKEAERFRFWGDLIYLYPILYLLIF